MAKEMIIAHKVPNVEVNHNIMVSPVIAVAHTIKVHNTTKENLVTLHMTPTVRRDRIMTTMEAAEVQEADVTTIPGELQKAANLEIRDTDTINRISTATNNHLATGQEVATIRMAAMTLHEMRMATTNKIHTPVAHVHNLVTVQATMTNIQITSADVMSLTAAMIQKIITTRNPEETNATGKKVF